MNFSSMFAYWDNIKEHGMPLSVVTCDIILWLLWTFGYVKLFKFFWEL